MRKKSHSRATFLRSSFSLQLAPRISCIFLHSFYFFVARCLYRNPFSLLVRVIRGFKTAFHHQTLQRSWRGWCHCRCKETEATTRTSTVTKARGELVPGTVDREWLDANRPASFDGLSVEKEAGRSARIYRYCIRHWRLQLARQASRRWRDIENAWPIQ